MEQEGKKVSLRARRLAILQQVESGTLSLDEASLRLAALENGIDLALDEVPSPPAVESLLPATSPALPQAEEAISPEGSPFPSPSQPEVKVSPDLNEPVQSVPSADRSVMDEISEGSSQQFANNGEPHAPWSGWWLFLFIPGLLLVAASAEWMYEGFLAARIGWGVILSLIPLTLGVLLIWLGWESRLARWLHVRIHQKRGAHPDRFTLSFPLPTGLLSWGLRRFGHFIPSARGLDVGEFLREVDQTVATDGPMHVLVEDPNGEHVEIWVEGPRRKN